MYYYTSILRKRTNSHPWYGGKIGQMLVIISNIIKIHRRLRSKGCSPWIIPNHLILACKIDSDWLTRKVYTSIHQNGSTSLATSIATPLATLTSNWISDIYNAFWIKWYVITVTIFRWMEVYTTHITRCGVPSIFSGYTSIQRKIITSIL